MRGLRRLFRLPDRILPSEEGIDEEIRFHLQMRTEELEAKGLDPAAAREEALRQFGDVESVRRQTLEEEDRRRRSVKRAELRDELRQDFVHGLRILRRAPGFAALAAVTLALGIGASTAIFSVVSGVLLQPLPFDRPDELVRIWTRNPARDVRQAAVSLPDFEDWAKPNPYFTSMGAYSTLARGLVLTGLGEAVRLDTAYVSAGFFATLGLGAAVGRVIGPEEHEPGRNQVVVLSHSAWRRRFGGDPAIAGRSVRLDGKSFTVLGVLPASVRFPTEATEAFAPLSLIPESAIPRLRFVHWLSVIGRRRPGVSVAQAQAGMDSIARALEDAHPDSNAGWGLTTVAPLRDTIVGDARQGLLVLLGAVGLLLVLACANVANLLLARTSAREHELALRAALGAGRWRLVRQLLCESLLLSAAGGALGIACAAWGIDALVALSGRYLPRAAEVRMDGRVLSVGIVLAFATGLASGLLPALRGTKAAPMTALRESGSSATARSGRLRDALVALEVAMALVLVLCAGLMANSFLRLTRVDPGFDADHTLVARFDIPDDRYPDDRIVAVYDRLIDRVRQVPGVIAAGAIKDVPLRGQGESYSYTVPGEPAPPPGAEPHADTAPVSPGYFRALGIELLAGRDIEPTDTDRSPAVAVVNQALARAAFSGRDPIGRTILVGRVPVRVVGLVRDVYNERLDVPPRPAIFLPETQMTRVVVSLVVRTQGQPMLLLPAVRDAIRSVDGDLALTELAPLRTIVAESLSAPRFLSVLLGIFGAIALVLATVGLYGVVATAVSQRRREMGIRMALGADRASVIARTLRRGMVPVALGLATGALAALGALRLLSGLLYGVGPFDPATVLATIALLLSAALVAAWVPARRAALVDPMTVLRAD